MEAWAAVEQVGGELVVVESLMADGVDPHSYRATPRDIARLAPPDIVVTGDGRHVAVRTPAGTMALLREGAGEYVRDMLSASSGDEAPPTLAAAAA